MPLLRLEKVNIGSVFNHTIRSQTHSLAPVERDTLAVKRGTEVMEQTGVPSIQTILRKLQLRWNGYLEMANDERLLKRLFYRNATTGDRRQRGETIHCKDTLLTSLKEFKSIRTPEMISPRIDRSGEEQGRLEHPFTKSVESPPPKPKERLINSANPQPKIPTNSNVSTTSSDIPRADRSRRTSPGSIPQ
nr:unnamed protein product [Spirometra erinaceieuropaei]